MKRLNPETGQPFERGYRRQDGRYFFQYNVKYVRQDGYFGERWLTEKALNNYKTTQRKVKKTYAKNFPAKIAEVGNRNRAKRLKRMPRWIKDVFIDEIKQFYKMARELEKIFPWKQHVDHVIPMKGKLVSGLHVPWNLQILSKKANLEKGNRYVDQSDAPQLPEGNYKNGRVYTQFGIVSAPRTGEDSDDAHHHCGADARKDADCGAETSGGDGVGHRGEEVGALDVFDYIESSGALETAPRSLREAFERLRSQFREPSLAVRTASQIRQFGD